VQFDPNQFLTPDAVLIYVSRLKMSLLVLGAAGFVVAGIFLWRTDQLTNQIIGVTSILFFGACLVAGLVKLVIRKPVLAINSIGIASGRLNLAWEEIESIYVSSVRSSTFSSQRFLSIRPKDVKEFIRHQPAIRAISMKANMTLVGAPWNIAANTLPMELEDLIKIIRQRCPTPETLFHSFSS